MFANARIVLAPSFKIQDNLAKNQLLSIQHTIWQKYLLPVGLDLRIQKSCAHGCPSLYLKRIVITIIHRFTT